MSLFNEPVWFSGRPGEVRVCGGCHEDRSQPVTVTPAAITTFINASDSLFSTTPRGQRLRTNPASADQIVGVPWNTQVQPILDTNCIACHDAANTAGVQGYTIVDPVGGSTISVTLDLTGGPLPASLATVAGGAFSRSYFSLAGPDIEAIERNNLMIMGNFKVYLKPLDARSSILIQKLNPTQVFPTPSSARAFVGAGHLPSLGRTDLSPLAFYTLILAADMGVNYFARENNPHLGGF
jgi:hypothetical protein